MEKHHFTGYDVFVTFLSLFSYVIDVGSDILLIVTFLLEGHQVWASLSMAFVALSTFLMLIFSFCWHATDKTLTWKMFFIHALFLAPIHRYIQTIRLGFRARQTRSQQDLDAVFRANNDICLLRLIECFVESAPQLILQLYIIMLYHHQFTWVLGVSTALSLISLAWSMTAYTDGLRLAYKDKYNRKWLSMLVQTTWQMAMVSARVMAIVVFSTLYQAWIFLAMGIHWCLMTVWITLQNADFGETACEKRLFNSVSGFIYIFCFLNLKDSKARWRILAYHVIILGENSLLMLLWFLGRPDVVPLWMEISAISVVFGGYIIGGVFMVIYYSCCHPTGPKPGEEKEMAYWFRRYGRREEKTREPIFDGPCPPPHVADWLNASLNLSLNSKADRLSVSHDPGGRPGLLEYSQNLGRCVTERSFRNSPVMEYQSYREPSVASTLMESDGDLTRDSAKLSYISASSSRNLIDSTSNLSVDSADRYYQHNGYRSSSYNSIQDRYTSSRLDTPDKPFSISTNNNMSGSYLSPKHTTHDSFYSSPEFKTKKLSPLDAKKLWEDSQDRIDQSVAQTITIVTHTDVKRRSSQSIITWRKTSQSEIDTSQNSNMDGEGDDVYPSVSCVSTWPAGQSPSPEGQTSDPVQVSDHGKVSHYSDHQYTCMSTPHFEEDRFRILNESQKEEVSSTQHLDALLMDQCVSDIREEPHYGVSGKFPSTEQLPGAWSQEDIPYIDASEVDEEEHKASRESRDTSPEPFPNPKQESMLSDWFAYISSLHHSKSDHFRTSDIANVSNGRSTRDTSTGNESSWVSTDCSYTDTSVEPRSISTASFHDRSHSLSAGPDNSSISLEKYRNSQSSDEESSYRDDLRTKSSHMTSGYCGSKVDISDIAMDENSCSSRALSRESGMDRGLQHSDGSSYSGTSHTESDSMNVSSSPRQHKVDPVYSQARTLNDSGYHRSASVSSHSGGELMQDDGVAESRDYSVRPRSDGDYSIRSWSDGDYSIRSRSGDDCHVSSRSGDKYSIGSRSDGDYSIRSRSDGDYSIRSRSGDDCHVSSRSGDKFSIGSRSDGDYSIRSRSSDDNNVSSRSGDKYSVGSRSDGDYSIRSKSGDDYNVRSMSGDDYSVGSRSGDDYSRSPSDMSRPEELFTRTKSRSKIEAVHNQSYMNSTFERGLNRYDRTPTSYHDDQIVPNGKRSISPRSATNSLLHKDLSGTSHSVGDTSVDSSMHSTHGSPDTSQASRSSRNRSARKRSSLFNASIDTNYTSMSSYKALAVNVHDMKNSPVRLGRNIDLFNVSSWRQSMDLDTDDGFTEIKSLQHIPSQVINKPITITSLSKSPYKFRPRQPQLALTRLTESPYKFRMKQNEDNNGAPSDKENDSCGYQTTRARQKPRRSLPTKPLYLSGVRNDSTEATRRRKSDIPLALPCYVYSSEGETAEDSLGGQERSGVDRRVLGALENTPGFSPIIVPEELHRVKAGGLEAGGKLVKPIVSTPLTSQTFWGSYQQLDIPGEHFSTVEV